MMYEDRFGLVSIPKFGPQSDDIREKMRGKGLPGGWVPLLFHECQCGHDRDAVVLCERSVDDGDHGTRYVVWNVNMDLGGCFTGHYTDDVDSAMGEYGRRKERLK